LRVRFMNARSSKAEGGVGGNGTRVPRRIDKDRVSGVKVVPKDGSGVGPGGNKNISCGFEGFSFIDRRGLYRLWEGGYGGPEHDPNGMGAGNC